MTAVIRRKQPLRLNQSLLVILVIYALVCSVYFVLRFNGLFIEVDTSSQSRIIYSALQAHSIANADTVYSNGFLYTAVSLFLVQVCGISIPTLQVVIYPLMMFAIVIPVFIAYRVLIRHVSITFLATMLLFCQPDFLFVMLRGSHERFTWTLVVMLVFFLAKTLTQRDVRVTFKYMIGFYLTFFALVATNTFFASSFAFGLFLTFAGGHFLLYLRMRIHRSSDVSVRRQLQRPLYLAVSIAILMYFFIFYLYTPAYENLRALKYLVDKLAVVLLGEAQSFNPYTTFVQFNWVSSQIYLLITIFSWVVLGISMIVWVRGAFGFLRQKRLAEEHLPQLFLWLMYAAFGLLLAGSAVSDRTNALTGNFQVRIFTPVMLFAIPIAAIGVWPIIRSVFRHRIFRLLVALVAVPVLAWFSLSSILKASMEPVISDKFMFTTFAENSTGDWLVRHIASGSLVWTGLDERVVVSMYYRHLGELDYDTGPFRIMATPTEATDYYMFSTTEKLRWLRRNDPIPYFEDEDLVYDNGTVQVFHRRPRTPYQK